MPKAAAPVSPSTTLDDLRSQRSAVAHAVNDAASAKEQAHARRDLLYKREAEWQRWNGPNRMVTEGTVPTDEELLRIRRERPSARDLADADDTVALADAANRSAREALTDLDLRICFIEEQPHVAAVHAAAEVLRRAVDRYNGWEDTKEARLGPQVERLSTTFNGVMTGTPTFQPALDVWREKVRSYGFVLEDPK